MDDLQYYIPRRLDDVLKLLWWEFDVAAFTLVGLMAGIWVGGLWTFVLLGLGVLASWGFGYMKSGKHPGFTIHVYYWFLPSERTFKRTPPSHLRELIG